MGILYVVGIGGGNRAGMTQAAYDALVQADTIVGYTTYTDLIAPLFPQKECYATGMLKETERCRIALDMAQAGKTIALVCSGDAGVYGMASLVYELSEQSTWQDVAVEVIAGVTAAQGGAAVLGAPLAHDFCVISLSDLLTPQPVIEKRLQSAAQGDFCIALYNPRSKRRPDSLRRACTLLLQTLPAHTVCGWVRNIGRDGEEAHVCTLSDLADAPLDMFCTAFIGNSTTRLVINRGTKKMITPRGYDLR